MFVVSHTFFVSRTFIVSCTFIISCVGTFVGVLHLVADLLLQLEINILGFEVVGVRGGVDGGVSTCGSRVSLADYGAGAGLRVT
jgi:hypothetical protein